VTRKHLAARVAVTGTVSFAALVFSNAIAFADPPAPTPVPQDPAAVNNAAPAEEQQTEEQPAEKSDCPWCEVVKAAQQIPPPNLDDAIPSLADVSVPVSFGVGLPDIVPDLSVPVHLPGLGMPQLPPPPKFQLPPPPKLQLGPPKLPF